MHDDREASAGTDQQTSFSYPPSLLLPDYGAIQHLKQFSSELDYLGSPLLCYGVCEWRGLDVPNTAVRQVQRACGCVSMSHMSH